MNDQSSKGRLFQAFPQDYWNRPSSSASAGDQDENEIYRAVGMASSRWEMVEHALYRLFLTLNDSQSAAAGKEYGAVTTSPGHRDMVKAAADAFNKRLSTIEGEVSSTDFLLQSYSEAASRRADIIHAVVAEFKGRGHYLIVPLYSSRKRIDKPLTITDFEKLDPIAVTRSLYAFVSKDIVSFCDKFGELFDAISNHQTYLWERHIGS